jgi:histidinol phosphatase-like PHP family hydrolase
MNWTEESIERRVEVMTDHVDADYMSGEITTEQYRERMDEINAWADARYCEITKGT